MNSIDMKFVIRIFWYTHVRVTKLSGIVGPIGYAEIQFCETDRKHFFKVLVSSSTPPAMFQMSL